MLERTNPYQAGGDEYYMYEALMLAQGGMGWAAPNPLVGCVLMRDGVIIGRGFHARDGERHAEVQALRAAGDARGATAYVSLEPCSHVGRQPSCCRELAQAGIARVVWGADDSDPRSARRAKEVLGALGVAATGRALVKQCEQFLDYYSHARSRQRSFVHLKLALSLDGKVACPSGHSHWISGPQSLGYAHYLRFKYDAVLVSHRTALADDPRLTVRAGVLAEYDRALAEQNLRQPVRVVLDPRGELIARLPELKLAQLDSGVFREHLPRLVIIAGAGCGPPVIDSDLIRIVQVPRKGSAPMRFEDIARQLWELGVHSVLIEGGGRLAAELLTQHAADKVSFVYSPKILGNDGIGFTPELGCARIAECPRLSPCRGAVLGDDVVLEGYPAWQ